MATLAQKLAKRAGDYVRVTTTLSLPVTATANTDYAAITLPPGAINLSYRTFTTTAYTAGTDAKISIGSTAGGVDYVAATTIAAIGVKSHTPVDAAAAVHLAPGALTLFVRVTQSGTATAVGAATLCIDYSLPVS
jgi:hypothetical protein